MFGWILFRAGQIWVVGQFISAPGEQSLFKSEHAIFLIPLIGFFLLEILFRRQRIDRYMEDKGTAMRWSVYGFALICTLLYSSRGDMQFIYFQF
jgi:positive regulator of sigma E activity